MQLRNFIIWAQREVTNGLGEMDIVDDFDKNSFCGLIGLEALGEKLVPIANTYWAFISSLLRIPYV